MFIIAVGSASIVFFGVCAGLICYKITQIEPGLVIDKEGITDYSNAASFGLIQWEDITDIYLIDVRRQKTIMLEVSNPDEYVQKQTYAAKRKATRSEHETYETPISIRSEGLKCNVRKVLLIA
jgi:hypothetical protein